MKAIVLHEYGPPENLRLEDTAVPEPGKGQVRVKVRATAINDWDWCFARGQPHIYRLLFGLRRPKVRILGAELAGTIEALGPGAHKFQVGDDVYGDTSEAGFGGFAQYASVSEHALGLKPPSMSFEQAAALPHAALLALQGLVDMGKLADGERVLINGAGGGVGAIGLQIAKRRHAMVTGVDSAAKLQAMKALGFDHVIDYRERDFTKSGERYDLILDTKTTRSPLQYLRALKPSGRYVTVGGEVPYILQVATMSRAIRAASGKRMDLVSLKPNLGLDASSELFTEGALRLLIDGPYPLEHVPQALARFGAAEHIGKVVITVA